MSETIEQTAESLAKMIQVSLTAALRRPIDNAILPPLKEEFARSIRQHTEHRDVEILSLKQRNGEISDMLWRAEQKRKRTFTEEEIKAWAGRYDLNRSMVELRAMFDDARTL